MSNRQAVNREVQVTGYYFRRSARQSFPKSIEYDGQRYTFLEQGMQYLIQKGQHLVKLFDATDGQSTYRLKYDNDRFLWTLVHITPAGRAL